MLSDHEYSIHREPIAAAAQSLPDGRVDRHAMLLRQGHADIHALAPDLIDVDPNQLHPQLVEAIVQSDPTAWQKLAE